LKRPRKRCRVCRKKTVFVCAACPDAPALCLRACFSSRH
jgi:hypothetical protein